MLLVGKNCHLKLALSWIHHGDHVESMKLLTLGSALLHKKLVLRSLCFMCVWFITNFISQSSYHFHFSIAIGPQPKYHPTVVTSHPIHWSLWCPLKIIGSLSVGESAYLVFCIVWDRFGPHWRRFVYVEGADLRSCGAHMRTHRS